MAKPRMIDPKPAGPKPGEPRPVEPRGIKWSAPVLIRKQGTELVVSVPTRVTDKLGAGAGDVLNFTELPDGAIEVWLVKRGTYASLEDMAQPSGRDSPANKTRKGKQK